MGEDCHEFVHGLKWNRLRLSGKEDLTIFAQGIPMMVFFVKASEAIEFLKPIGKRFKLDMTASAFLISDSFHRNCPLGQAIRTIDRSGVNTGRRIFDNTPEQVI